MTPLALAWRLAELPEFPPLATRLEREHWPQTKKVWYGNSQRMHWCGHLQAIHEAGQRDTAKAYGRIQNLAMLIWIADALQVPAEIIEKATAEAIQIEWMRLPGWPQRACNAFRRYIPWATIDAALKQGADQ